MPELPTLDSVALDSDEDDGDYVPGEQDSDSDSEAGPNAKKQRVEETQDTTGAKNLVTDDVARNSLWNSFLESTKSTSADSEIPTSKTEAKTITIEKRYRFAGEDVIEKIEVAEDSPEAQQWRSRQPPDEAVAKTSLTSASSAPTPEASTPNTTSVRTSPSPKDAKAAPIEPTKPKPVAKPRKSLSSLAAAAKPKKLSTLDKSRMDWQSHLASSTQEERDELERNRKSGGAGYLEKVDFLTRVGERRENVFEDNKRKRR